MSLRQHGMSAFWPEARRYPRLPTPLSTFCTLLAFGVLLTLSGPHLVHHLLDTSPPGDEHSHEDEARQLPDCLVLALIQHTPVMAGPVGLLPQLLPAPELLVVTPSRRWLHDPTDVVQARAPPGASIHSL